MITRSVYVLAGLWLAGAAIAQEGDPEAGQALARQCQTCHGRDGIARIPIAPNIGGEPAAYLANQLAAFREGTRVHEMMSVVAKGLSDQDIADLAVWYAGWQPVATLSAPAADAPQPCMACHGADGISRAADVPHLAGESVIYLETQLKAFRSGRRTHAVMSDIAAGLSDADIRALAEWYAAVDFTVQPRD